MGLFDKLLKGADKVDDVKTTLEYNTFRDRRYDAAERLAAKGDPGTAIITGIRARSSDNSTEYVFRLEWNDGSAREGAVLFGGNPPMAMRIGAEVLVRTDGGAVVLDADAMAEVPTAANDPGRKKRTVPDVGVDDKALDARVLSHLKKWVPSRGTITSWERTKAFGMLTDNWNIVVTKADGGSASASRDNVPNYARWFVHPGSEVPITVDPKNPEKMQVNWPALAEERAGGTWRDVSPEGSIAADLLLSRNGPAESAMSIMDEDDDREIDVTPSAESAGAIEGVTIEKWGLIEAALIEDRVAPADYDSYATEKYGVPAGRWTAIVAEWNARLRGGDWRVGAAFGEAFEAAQKQFKQAKKG